ncbi:hypothetical protein RCH06_002324 [Polaromonas sp. CG_9.5]|uniref:hypothetical protein n=1 Tax=Polaromonas sp. CG_9.5 TaxID=3071705 RepID=UPI002DFB0FD3|nr:hypothetical protein [Polaromonas sp. CG_9.5]
MSKNTGSLNAPDDTAIDAPKSQLDPASKHPHRGEEFGLEGTNKTISVPLPNAAPAEELEGTKTKYIPSSPYTRG